MFYFIILTYIFKNKIRRNIHIFHSLTYISKLPISTLSEEKIKGDTSIFNHVKWEKKPLLEKSQWIVEIIPMILFIFWGLKKYRGYY